MGDGQRQRRWRHRDRLLCTSNKHTAAEISDGEVDGAYGSFTFNVAEKTITLDFNQRIVDVKTPSTSSKHNGTSLSSRYYLVCPEMGRRRCALSAIHTWFDEFRKRSSPTFAIVLSATTPRGFLWLETIFGTTLSALSGRVIPTRWVGEQHVLEDLGRIPSFADWASAIQPGAWMLPLPETSAMSVANLTGGYRFKVRRFAVAKAIFSDRVPLTAAVFPGGAVSPSPT